MGSPLSAVAVAVLCVLLGSVAAEAQSQTSYDPTRPTTVEHGRIHGRVVDAATGEPLAVVDVRLVELGRSELSHRDGSFHFENVAPGRYTIAVERLGYAPLQHAAHVADTLYVILRMAPSALNLPGIIVTGAGTERGGSDAYRTMAVLSGAELRRRLDSGVAATIAHLPGISQQYNGPAANQPVIRGMGGDRVLVLEDGQRSGDLAATAGDHALTADPIAARRIEVVRGPAALLYGSNALGGVINVVREEVPRTLPDGIAGAASVRAASVNGELSGGGNVLFAVGRMALRAELSGRTAGETRTPLGRLPSTEFMGLDASFGTSLVERWGFAGVAYREQLLDYRLPGEFNGEAIPGAHPSGVETEARRRTLRMEAVRLGTLGPFNRLRAEAAAVHYRHAEIEGRDMVDGTARRFVGTEFDQVMATATLIAHHTHAADAGLWQGAAGLWGLVRDLNAGGRFPGTRSASEYALAGFVFEEVRSGPWSLEAGGRFDLRRVTPVNSAPIRVEGRDIPVRQRAFNDLSGSISMLYDVGSGITLGATAARAFRTPALEELFSDGPHLADFSFNIGNPDLESETGLGLDGFLRVTRNTVRADAAVFRNRIRNYIHYAPTGERDPRFGRFPVFQATGADAVFTGAEAQLEWEVVRRLVVDGTVSYVRATRLDDADPLPAIPPLNGSSGVRFDDRAWFAGLSRTWTAAQNRVPRPLNVTGELITLEPPTPGYGLWNATAGFRTSRGGRLHSLTLRIDNITDQVWRDHLSRLKEVAPQPGRNIQMLYRVEF